MHALGHPRHRPDRGRRGVRRAVQPVGVLGRGGGRARVAHRRTGGQHDGRGHAGKVGEQQSRGRAAGQETISDGRLQRARQTVNGDRLRTLSAVVIVVVLVVVLVVVVIVYVWLILYYCVRSI